MWIHPFSINHVRNIVLGHLSGPRDSIPACSVSSLFILLITRLSSLRTLTLAKKLLANDKIIAYCQTISSQKHYIKSSKQWKWTCTVVIRLNLLQVRFSVWPWIENARTKQKQQTNGNRAIWLVHRTDTKARGFWLVKRTFGWKNCLRTF